MEQKIENKISKRYFFLFVEFFFGILSIFVYFLSFLVKRNKNKWVFSSWEGKFYRGNSKILFEHVSKKKNIKCIWVTKNKNLYKENRNKIQNFKYAYSISGIYSLLTSKYIFFSHGIYDFIGCLTNGSILIGLGHTIYPIKKMSFVNEFNKLSVLKKIFLIISYPLITKKPNYEIVVSKNTKNSTIFLDKNLDKDCGKIINLGYPKTDHFINLKNQSKHDLLNFINYQNKKFDLNKKIILFLPTWRKDKKFNLFNFKFNNFKINEFLKRFNSYLIINFHPFDENLRLKKSNNENENIILSSFKGDEIINVLRCADIFVTDYSSLFSDYLLTDKPIIFTKFDHENYVSNDRELVLEFNDLPGSIVSNWDDLFIEINNLFVDNKDNFLKKRQKWKEFIYSGNNDGNSSERIFQFFNTIH